MEEVKISEEELAELKALDHEYAIRERKSVKHGWRRTPEYPGGNAIRRKCGHYEKRKNKNTLKLWRNTKSYFKNKQSNK